MLRLAHRPTQPRPSRFEPDPPLTAAERRRVALAALQIQERRYQLRLVQIQQERRALLAGQRAGAQ